MKVAKTSVKAPACCRRRGQKRVHGESVLIGQNYYLKARVKARGPHREGQGRFVGGLTQ